MDTPKTITHLGLCAGYGGIELGLHRVLGNLRTVALCEIEAFACANLVAKMEAGLMDAAPIWTDLKTFPWAEFRDRVDILTGGYPCQPFSAAGKRLGTEDPRHLWPFIASGIRILRPKLCYFENVEGHISLGLREVLGDLGAAGYTAAWGIFSASEVGAPHQRKRVFILAYRHGERGQLPDWWRVAAEQVPVGDGEAWGDGQWPSRPGEQQFAWEPPRVVVDAKSQRAGQRSELRSEECGSRSALSWDIEQPGEGAVANDHRAHAGHGEQRPERTRGDLPGGCGEELDDDARLRSREPADGRRQAAPRADASGEASMGNATKREDHGRESRDMGIAPSQGGSGDHAADGAGEVLADAERELRPRWSEWIGRGIGQPSEAECDAAGSGGEGNGMRQTQPPLGGDTDGPAGGLGYAELCVSCDNRTDELRLLGNGVVPATAERAFLTLWEELFQEQPTN